MTCRHLTQPAAQWDSIGCTQTTCVGASWDALHCTSIARPWWQTHDGQLTAPAVLIVLTITGLVVVAALVVGQHLQDQRCASAVGTADACTSHDDAQQLHSIQNGSRTR